MNIKFTVRHKDTGETLAELAYPMRDLDLDALWVPGADFSETKFEACSFVAANLEGATFERATLSRCDLRHAALTGCNFDSAHIIDCDFREADLNGSSILGAKLEGFTSCPPES